MIISGQSSIFGSQDEHRSTIFVGICSTDESWIVGCDQETDEEETEDVEQGNTPKDLFDGAWKSFGGIGRFGRCETHEFCTGKGEGGCDEHSAETSESILESTGLVPISNLTSAMLSQRI